MKIAFCVLKNITHGGGIEKYTLELGSRLAARGHQITVYCMSHYGKVSDVVRGMRVIGVPSFPFRSMEKFSSAASAAIYSIFNTKPDIAHFHSVAAGSFAWLSRIRGLPCVLQMHGLEWKRSRWGFMGSTILRLLEKSALKQTKICTAVSKTQCDYFIRKHGIQMKYIPPGADIKEKVTPQEIFKIGLKPKSYILFASRLVREKGAHYLIPAFRRLKTDCKLIIAGDVNGENHYKKDLHKLAANDSRIIFPGFVRGRLLEELFSHTLIYVHPSDLEGLSIALLEAMSYGNCCLVSDIPENLEAIGDTGFHFTSKNVDSLEQQLNWLLRHPQDVAAVSMRAKERVRLHYSWEIVTEQIEDLYLSVLRS